MKIKTKRGARRTRNQRVIDRRFVVTDYEGCSYITAGKEYRVADRSDPDSYITDDVGDINMAPTTFKSAHLNKVGTWYHPIR